MIDPVQRHQADLDLAQACCRGNPQAWECFSQLYRQRLYAAALTISHDVSIARELVDSLYGDMFASKLKSYSGRGSLEGWLRAVLSRAYVDRYRSQRRVVSLDERLLAMAGEIVEPLAVDPRLNDAVKEAFLVLPAEDRYLLAVCFFDQKTLAQVALILGVHESTVSRRLDRLIKRLRSQITRRLRDKGMTLRQVEESLATDVRDLTLDLRSQLVQE
jgi:RNA polymerase sigma-70 factor (ECF subfamily)